MGIQACDREFCDVGTFEAPGTLVHWAPCGAGPSIVHRRRPERCTPLAASWTPGPRERTGPNGADHHVSKPCHGSATFAGIECLRRCARGEAVRTHAENSRTKGDCRGTLTHPGGRGRRAHRGRRGEEPRGRGLRVSSL